MTIRVRFAPSPTGNPHVGNIRSALFNWLLAKKMKGVFILRIEDTDQERLVEGSLEAIYESLRWLGLNWNEGPEVGGTYEPYIQSQRLALYKQKAQELVEKNSAYYCFCSEDRLEKLRQEQTASKLPPQYDGLCKNLSAEEIAEKLQAAKSEKCVIRQNIPKGRILNIPDCIQGDVEFNTNTLDDTVLLKSDGFPTYHLANVVDDIAMEITHVIRAVEWLPSLPKHILLYEAFGQRPPQFAHLPLILGPDKSKLSKRNGAKGILDLKNEGFIPAGVINALSLLGWSSQKGGNTDSEIMSVDEIIDKFSLEAIQKSPAIFDEKKLLYFNAEHLRKLNNEDYLKYWQEFDSDKNLNLAAVKVVKDRAQTLKEANNIIQTLLNYQKPDRDLISKKEGTIEVSKIIAWWREWLEQQTNWTAENLRLVSLNYLTENNLAKSEWLWPLRVVITGQENSPEVFSCLEFLGQDESLKRLKTL